MKRLLKGASSIFSRRTPFVAAFDIRREKQYSCLRFGSIFARTERSHFHHSFLISAAPRQENHDENEPFQFSQKYAAPQARNSYLWDQLRRMKIAKNF